MRPLSAITRKSRMNSNDGISPTNKSFNEYILNKILVKYRTMFLTCLMQMPSETKKLRKWIANTTKFLIRYNLWINLVSPKMIENISTVLRLWCHTFIFSNIWLKGLTIQMNQSKTRKQDSSCGYVKLVNIDTRYNSFEWSRLSRNVVLQ